MSGATCEDALSRLLVKKVGTVSMQGVHIHISLADCKAAVVGGHRPKRVYSVYYRNPCLGRAAASSSLASMTKRQDAESLLCQLS